MCLLAGRRVRNAFGVVSAALESLLEPDSALLVHNAPITCVPLPPFELGQMARINAMHLFRRLN